MVPGTVCDLDVAEHVGRAAVVEVPHDVGQVLVQRAAQLHVEDLAAAADGEHGQVGGERGGEQGPLAGVPDRVDAADLGRGLLAVGERVDVSPAGEHQAVEHGDHLVGARPGPAGALLGGGRSKGRPPAAATSSK